MPRRSQSSQANRNVDDKGFSMKNIFPLSIVPKPILSMQNMFSFSKSNPNERLKAEALQKTTNKTLWRQLDHNPESKPMKPNRHYGEKSNGFSRLYTFDEKKTQVRRPIFQPRPSLKSSQQNIEPIKRDNHFRSSAVALFGGNADYGWRKVTKSTTKRPKARFSLEETIRKQARLNSVINAYKNNSLSIHRPENRKKLVDIFSQNMKLEYNNHKTKTDADDALLRSKNSDHRKPFNHL